MRLDISNVKLNKVSECTLYNTIRMLLRTCSFMLSVFSLVNYIFVPL